VARAKSGDPEAFEILVRRHLRAAYAVALAVLGRPADAEDVAQDAFAAAFEQLDRCREPAKFSGWLLSIVRNRAKNEREKRGLRDPAEAPPEAAAGPPAEAGLRDRLVAALGRLPATAREVVLLHDLEGYSHAEIADAIGTSEVNSRQLLFQARKTLRELLGDDASPEVRHERA
jgi:RNA polymerase sigma-70 factor (ECF subfamily)